MGTNSEDIARQVISKGNVKKSSISAVARKFAIASSTVSKKPHRDFPTNHFGGDGKMLIQNESSCERDAAATSSELDQENDLSSSRSSKKDQDKSLIGYSSPWPSSMSGSTRNNDDAINEVLLEKLKTCACKPQENLEVMRSVAARLHSRVTSTDRRTKERTLEKLWRKNTIEIFLKIFENCKDHVTNCTVAGILHEYISPKVTKTNSKGSKNRNKIAIRNNSRMAMIQLINFGGTQTLTRLLSSLQHRDTMMTEVLVQELLWILGQIAQKDGKFSTKVKLLNSTKMFHSLLKLHYNHGKTLLPLLLIIKSLAKNTCALQILVKDGIVPTLEKTFVCIGYTPHVKLRILLESFKYFTVNRLCCTKFVKIGLIHLLMRLFERWERFDGPIRLKICNYCLHTLQHISVTKSGRKAIKSNNGLQLLYRFCINCPEDKAYDCLLSRVCGIINQCLEKKELPVPEMSPARFILPELNSRSSNSADSGSDADSQVNSVVSLGRLYSDPDSCDEEESDNSRKSKQKNSEVSDDLDEKRFFSGVISSQRSEKELLRYNSFFSELGDLQNQLTMAKSIANKCTNGDGPDSVRTIHHSSSWINKLKIVVDDNETRSSQRIERKTPDRQSSTKSLNTFNDISSHMNDEQVYCMAASSVRSVISFVKVAYPDLVGGDGLGEDSPLISQDRKVCRSKLLTCVDRGLRPGSLMHESAYDLDQLTSTTCPADVSDRSDRLLCNWDDKYIGKRLIATKQLQFESRFESGNLRKAIQIGHREYDLILTPDVNSDSRHQWFYFEVSNMEADLPYTFNIVNCEKANSQFNFGMKPILFSVREAQLGRSGWVRTGTDICYYRNCYQRPGKGKNYLTTSFTVTFPHSYDVCYLAYHFPYTYSQLMTKIWKWSKTLSPTSIYFRAEPLCMTLNKNETPVLTITSPESNTNPIESRKIIFLTSRVHPGESNASWIMDGTLEALLSNTPYASSLRDDYVFKIIPMLNIEGVVNGCNRYGLTSEDLNRRWSNPNETLHPVIFHAKGLMEYCTRVLQKPPHVFVDYHGHSRRKNVFLFGCSRSGSWSSADRAKLDQPVQYLMLPRLMQKTSPAFALPLCSFKVERNKESTARVAVWRQLGISRSYTMESSFCGCDQGFLTGLHLDTKHLKDIGRNFCEALSMMKNCRDDWTIDKNQMETSPADEDARAEDDLTSSCDSVDSDFDD